MQQTKRAGTTAWLGLGLLMIPNFMAAVDMTVLFLAIPTIASDLLPSGTQQLWLLHVGDIVGAGLVLTAGRVVDRFGPRRLLTFGLIGYGLASAFAAFAPSVEVLILARMLLGASAVTMAPAGMALLRQMFPMDRQFSVAVALFMAAFSGGMALGPPLGGFLLEHFWWGSIFLVNVPIAIVVAIALRLLPPVTGTGEGRIDLASVFLSMAGIASLVYGAQETAASGWSVVYGLAIVVGVVLIAVFVRRQMRLADPLLDLSLFRSVPFSLALVAIWLVIAASAGADLQFAQHLQVVSGFSPLAAGTLLVGPAVGSMLATAASPVLLRWMRPGYAIGLGVLVALAGAASMVTLITLRPESPAVALVSAEVLMAVGIAPVFAIGSALVLTHAPVSQAGSATSTQEVSGSLGNTVGLALGGMVAFLSYSTSMRASLSSDVDGVAAKQSTQSVGGALAAVETVPPVQAQQVADAAIAAFTIATRNTYIVAVIGFALLAVLAFRGLRHAQVDGDDEPRLEAAATETR